MINFFRKKNKKETTNSNTNLYLSVIARMLVNKYKHYEPMFAYDGFADSQCPIVMDQEDVENYKQMLFDYFSEHSTIVDRTPFYIFERELIHKYYPKTLKFTIIEGLDFMRMINNLSETDMKVFISYLKTNKISDWYNFSTFERNEEGDYELNYVLG